MVIYYAHSKRDPLTKELLPKEHWHPLCDHLLKTAERAVRFASSFNAEALAEAAGCCHDYGKHEMAFCRRLEDSSITADHKTAGALAVYRGYPPPYGLILAYIIFGHHNGLPDHITQRGGERGLEKVLKKPFEPIDGISPNLIPLDISSLRKFREAVNPGLSRSLFIRLLHSTLVDADFLDTEGFLRPEKAAMREAYLPLEELIPVYDRKVAELLSVSDQTGMNPVRKVVLQHCIQAAHRQKGLFSLTAPTGSGKTYATLAFAFEHAKYHAETQPVSRVIVALPFTSLIEQTVTVYREALLDIAGNKVLEHHSNVSYGKEHESEFDPRQLASENWDAGLIVTTNVQLFESLFAAKPSKTRKLHRLANSVIILDEAQTLPDGLLAPVLAALRCLCTEYGVTVLFSSATQPTYRHDLLGGVSVTPVVPEPRQLLKATNRVETKYLGSQSDCQLVEQITQHSRVLCIVNSRKQAATLYKMLSEEVGEQRAYHLSALMCAEHRTEVLKKIKSLPQSSSCYVIATPLLEAGVDLDFPVVYRQMAGIESIVQAAGRCNREGRLIGEAGETMGQLFLFDSNDHPGKNAWFRQRADFAKWVLHRYKDPLAPEAIDHYFKLFYGLGKTLDKHEILKNLNDGADEFSFQFEEIARKFRFIEQDTATVIIPWDDDCRQILRQAQNSLYPHSYIRKLQRYSVAVYPLELAQLNRAGRLRKLSEEVFLLLDREGGMKTEKEFYSPYLGLQVTPQEEE